MTVEELIEELKLLIHKNAPIVAFDSCEDLRDVIGVEPTLNSPTKEFKYQIITGGLNHTFPGDKE